MKRLHIEKTGADDSIWIHTSQREDNRQRRRTTGREKVIKMGGWREM